MALPLKDRIDEAVISIPGDGVERTNFGKDIVRDLSNPEKERANGYFPVRLLFAGAETVNWLFALDDKYRPAQFHAEVVQPVTTYNIPAIELDNSTSKAAVATVFEKVNTGGLALNVFELLTATFAGDKDYFDANGTDFRLNDDWKETEAKFAAYPALTGLENTDFLQVVTLLATMKRNRADTSTRPSAVSAKREDVLKLTLADYLAWVGPAREAFIWAADFLADRHIFDARFLPYPKQLVPLAAIKVVMGPDADLIGPRERITRCFWCGILANCTGALSKPASSATWNRFLTGHDVSTERRFPTRPKTRLLLSRGCILSGPGVPPHTKASMPCSPGITRGTGWRARYSTRSSTSTSPSTYTTFFRRSGASTTTSTTNAAKASSTRPHSPRVRTVQSVECLRRST
jgi:hypothetical protein